ncbi:MAG: hypothetical protein COU27_03155 [Candidatus Levybacteria bacterium CG10_big_fil_rev_8_21_14_0_10_36_7]|nr:MAG: hypothetical protein COU27_03155 [Candidatus Levybacteria bacterium CG10_big_fil_rev_8_21_14_0_10_36_7]
MIDLEKLQKIDAKIVTVGSYPAIFQSILDFDYISGKKEPSIKAIIATGRRYERYFWGRREILIPVFPDTQSISDKTKESINLFLNVSSARRVLSSTSTILNTLPNILGGVVFAEEVPEKQSLELYELCQKTGKFIIGPSSVGLLIPNKIKLGAIGGTDYRQLIEANLFEKGSVAVFSASGGMTNEIINIVTSLGKRLSFSVHFGGDRFPIIQPVDAFKLAENDKSTKTIVYYGELGGIDEYKIAQMLESKKITKTVICYIAGTISDLFETPPQFGHAKAMAQKNEETARAKRDALKQAGAKVAESFLEFVEMISDIPKDFKSEDMKDDIIKNMDDRTHALVASSISKDVDGKVMVLGEDLLSFSKTHSFAYIVSSLFLGKKAKSKEFEEFVDFVLRILVDHGPYMSGAVNTIVTARAGRDLVSSLATGILTIGPRFGGAINEAAGNWLDGASRSVSASDFVEEFATAKKYISGIGHRKYRIDLPDPRVEELLKFTKNLKGEYSKFAKEVEKITVAKKGNLILNVDGAIAAILLDILSEKEGYSQKELKKLVDIEFFNALFVLSRSVGFISHFLDQKRIDEGLFRLTEEQVADATLDS